MNKNQKYKPPYQDQNQNQNRTRVNDYIRIPVVMLINANNENLGAVPVEEAKRLAREAGLDLVEVAAQARPPVCRIMDYDKYKYEQAVKEKEKKKKQKQSLNQEKEIRLRPVIGDNDLEIKVQAARRFLEDGHRVRIHLQYKKRENAHKELGYLVVQRVIEKLAEFGTPHAKPQLEGSNLNCIIEPNKNE